MKKKNKKTKQPLSIVTLYKSMMIMGNGHDFGHACDVCDVVLISLQRGELEDVVLEMESGKIRHKTVLFKPTLEKSSIKQIICLSFLIFFFFWNVFSYVQGFTVKKIISFFIELTYSFSFVSAFFSHPFLFQNLSRTNLL